MVSPSSSTIRAFGSLLFRFSNGVSLKPPNSFTLHRTCILYRKLQFLIGELNASYLGYCGICGFRINLQLLVLIMLIFLPPMNSLSKKSIAQKEHGLLPSGNTLLELLESVNPLQSFLSPRKSFERKCPLYFVQ
ncbi:Uncharacterized protein Fot_09477 [Forsythia ovata]|uniref:Uncharacterized protein n=1 Tax=Forsythia ovata TaxID=205694 RepID=A0ABD1WE46_9LAMI